MIQKAVLLLCSIFTLFFLSPQLTHAQSKDDRFEGTVITILEEKEFETLDKKQLYQKLQIKVDNGRLAGNEITVESGGIPVANVRKFQVGDELVITANKDIDNRDVYFVQDYVRRSPLYLLFALFVGLTVLIGRKRGLLSLFGMVFSFGVIFTFVLPQISLGRDPIFIAILASFFIIPVTFYLSHGLNIKTTAAVIGTIISLIITGILANLFVDAARLTGFASEEANFIEAFNPGVVNIRGLLLAGIIIGVLGILDDITISQAAIVNQLKITSPSLRLGEIYSRAMDVGRDHIASVVNTLILVYTGAAMPLLLLFTNNQFSFGEVINYEVLAEEIVRTLVASIGLILAVPVTTFLAAYMLSRYSSSKARG